MEMQNVPYYVFNSPFETDEAIRSLSRSGLDVKNLSLIRKDSPNEEAPPGFPVTAVKIRSWGGVGAFCGGIWGMLVAPAVLVLPGVGLVSLAGPMVTVLNNALEGAAVLGGMSALGAALVQVGIARDQVAKCESAVQVDKYVLVVHGDMNEVASARAILTQLKLWMSM
jgi:hypothetical protein